MAVAKPSSRSSSYGGASSPIPHHRFDHMIEEQKNIVMNAQEGLNQSLLILEKATTKEELESAKLQVESLLPRCEELVTKLMVVINVRSELGCLQRDLMRAKKSKLKATTLYARQQWLENRLEKLIFSKRRARPGVRLQRGPTTCQDTRFSHQQAHGSRRTCQPPQMQFGDQFKTHKRSATISTMSDILGAPSFSQRDDEEMSSITSGSDRLTTVTQGVPERESSEWNSESEANWTVMDAYSNVSGKRYVQERQEKNEEEKIEEQDESEHNVNNQEGSNSTSQLQKPVNIGSHSTEGKIYFFEPPRSVSVFGNTSWNILALAEYQNFLDSCKEIASGPPEEIMKNPLIDKNLIILWTEVLKLQELVQSASRIMKKEGQTLPSLPSRNFLTSSSNNGGRLLSSKQSLSHTRTLSENDKYKLLNTVLPEITRGSTGQPRRVFSKLQKERMYPRSFHTEAKNKPRMTIELETQHDYDLVLSSSMSFKQEKKRISSKRPRSTILQRDVTCLVNEHLEEYKKSTIETLITTLDHSDNVERRRDVVEALKYLKGNNKSDEIIISLRKSMINDRDACVRYESMKSLITCGAWNSQLYLLVSELIVRGSTELKFDILSILLKEKSLITEEDTMTSCNDAKQILIQSLKDLVMNTTNHLSFVGNVILTEANVLDERCEQLFRQTLKEGTPQQVLKSLECLTNYYNCVDNEIIQNSMELAEESIHWKIRLSSVECLIRIYQLEQACSKSVRETVVKFVKRRLISEPIHTVRVAVGSLSSCLGEKERLENELIKQLERTNEMERAEAVIALSAFISGNSKVQNALMDVMEFDPSIFMRLLVASLIRQNGKVLTSITMSRLQGKCNGTGALAKYCQHVLASLIKGH